MNLDNKRKQSTFTIIIISVLVMIVFFVRILGVPTLSTELMSTMIQDAIVRFAIGLIFLLLMIQVGYNHLYKATPITNQKLFIILPAFIIAINNFPISAYIMNRAYINQPFNTLYIYLLECLSIGFFEEIAFRSMLLIVLLQYFPKSQKGIIYSIVVSSFIFGVTHVLNVFGGAGFGPTLLQIGYSFLLGIMFSIIYLKTKNIWIPIILHTIYNFTGGLFSRLGTVIQQFDWITIIITVAISFIALILYYKELQSLHPESIHEFCTPQ